MLLVHIHSLLLMLLEASCDLWILRYVHVSISVSFMDTACIYIAIVDLSFITCMLPFSEAKGSTHCDTQIGPTWILLHNNA